MNLRKFSHAAVAFALRMCIAVLLPTLNASATHAQTKLPPLPSPPRARLVEDLRIDAEREDVPRVSNVAVGPRGSIAVPLYVEGKIKLFDSTGKALFTVGRQGAGPGELNRIANIGWVADTMWVTDVNQRRVSYFGPNGKLIRTAANPLMSNKPVLGTAGPKQIGYFMATSVQNPIPFVEAPSFAFSSDLEHVAALTPLQTSPTGGTITVSLLRTTGITLFSKTFAYVGEPIPKAVRDSAIPAELKGDGPVTEGPSNMRVQRHAIAKRKTPTIYAGASFILLGLDNTVWLGLRSKPEGQTVLAFNAQGDAFASIVLPKNTRLRQASARNLWVTKTDDAGLSSVVRYRMVGTP